MGTPGTPAAALVSALRFHTMRPQCPTIVEIEYMLSSLEELADVQALAPGATAAHPQRLLTDNISKIGEALGFNVVTICSRPDKAAWITDPTPPDKTREIVVLFMDRFEGFIHWSGSVHESQHARYEKAMGISKGWRSAYQGWTATNIEGHSNRALQAPSDISHAGFDPSQEVSVALADRLNDLPGYHVSANPLIDFAKDKRICVVDPDGIVRTVRDDDVAAVVAQTCGDSLSSGECSHPDACPYLHLCPDFLPDVSVNIPLTRAKAGELTILRIPAHSMSPPNAAAA